jgi:hypothetical protein
MPRTKNEYTAVAGAEKRLGELLRAGGLFDPESVVRALTQGAEIEYKPRLKSLLITLRLPEPGETPAATEPGERLPDDARPIVEKAVTNLLRSGHTITGPDGIAVSAADIPSDNDLPGMWSNTDFTGGRWPEITQSGPDGTVLSLGFLPKDEPDAGYYPGEGDETDAS